MNSHSVSIQSGAMPYSVDRDMLLGLAANDARELIPVTQRFGDRAEFHSTQRGSLAARRRNQHGGTHDHLRAHIGDETAATANAPFVYAPGDLQSAVDTFHGGRFIVEAVELSRCTRDRGKRAEIGLARNANSLAISPAAVADVGHCAGPTFVYRWTAVHNCLV